MIKNESFKKYFKECHGINFDSLQIPYYDLSSIDMHKAELFEPLNVILDAEDMSAIFENNKLLDIQLYEAVERFDLLQVKKLLREGANPKAYIYAGRWEELSEEEKIWAENNGDGARQALDRIADEYYFLSYMLEDVIFKGKKFSIDKDSTVLKWLIGCAGHKQMLDILRDEQKYS